MVNLVNGETRRFDIPYSVGNKITLHPTSENLYFTAIEENIGFIARLFWGSGDVLPWTSILDGSSGDPLYSRGGSVFSWRGPDGLYVAFSGNTTPIKISDSTLVPLDFSPNAAYLGTRIKIFDLNRRTVTLLDYQGTLRFLNNNTVIYQSTTDDIFYQSNVTGSNKTPILGPLPGGLKFDISPDGKYLGYFLNNGSESLLLRVTLAESRQDTVVFNFGPGHSVRSMFWRDAALVP